MIYGMGVDIQSVSQFREILERNKQGFYKKIFTDQEIEYCQKYRDPSQHFAARWAVKEAFFKAMGTGVTNGYTFQDVQTLNLKSGKPIISLKGKTKQDVEKLDLKSHVSISHSDEYAVSVVLLYRNIEEGEG